MNRILLSAFPVLLIAGMAVAAPQVAKSKSAKSPAINPQVQVKKIASKVEVKEITAAVGTNIFLEARLISETGELLGGKTIEFQVNDQPVGSAPTADPGTASAGLARMGFHVSGDYPPGIYRIKARFAGDAGVPSGAGRANLNVVKAKTRIELKLDETTEAASIGGWAHIDGVLKNVANPDSVINDRVVTIRANNNTFTNAQTTVHPGRFGTSVPIPKDLSAFKSLVPKLDFTVEAEFAGDAYFEPAKEISVFTAHAQPPPKIEEVVRKHDKWIQIKGREFQPAAMDWNTFITEYKNAVQVYVDDGTGLKPATLLPNDAGAIGPRRIDISPFGLNLHSCKFKVVRQKQESNVFDFSYIPPSEIPITIKSIDPPRTRLGDPQESAFYISLYADSFKWVNNPGTKVIFASEAILPDKKQPATVAGEGWTRFYVPVGYRHLPGRYPIQLTTEVGGKSNIVYWELYKESKIDPVLKKKIQMQKK